MFESTVRQRQTLEMFHDSLSAAGYCERFPTIYWESISKLTKLLYVFRNATTILSGVYYPTSSLVLKQLYLMCSKLNDFEYKCEVYELMIIPMKEKF